MGYRPRWHSGWLSQAAKGVGGARQNGCVSNPELITAVDLDQWSGSLVAQTALLTGWELRTSRDPRVKARSDIHSRTKDPLGLDPKTATFVAVTSRFSRRWRAVPSARGGEAGLVVLGCGGRSGVCGVLAAMA